MKQKTMRMARRFVYGAVFALAGMAAAALPDPLIRWSMDAVENGKIVNSGTLGTDGDLTPNMAGCSLTNGISGKALYYDGTTNAYAHFTWPKVGSRTFAFWIRRNAGAGPWQEETISAGKAMNNYPYIISGAGGFGLHMANATTLPEASTDMSRTSSVILNKGCNKYVTPPPEIDHCAWTQIVLTFDLVSERKVNNVPVQTFDYAVYRNGQLTGTATGYEATNVVVSGGTALGSGNGYTRPIFGALDEVCVFDSALTASQVSELYERDARPQLLSRWTFDRAALTSGSYVFTNEVTGLADLTAGAGVILTNGVDGRAVHTDGTKASWLRAALNQPLGSHTWAGWFRFAETAPYDQTAKVGGQNMMARVIICDQEYIGLAPLNTDDGLVRLTTRKYPGVQQTLASGRIPRFGTWFHMAVASTFFQDAQGTDFENRTLFLNGACVGTTTNQVATGKTTTSIASTFYLLNLGNNGNRPFEGTVDDIRLYDGSLTEAQVREIYRGAACVDAGEDFTVAEETAELRGTVAAKGEDFGRYGYAGVTRWELVSAPAGGAGVAILTPDAPVTKVTLPVAGAYVFRLVCSADDGLQNRTDTVTVTRTASAAGDAPAVTAPVATTAMPGLPCALAATVTPGAGAGTTRVTWRKVSGPGGVWFEPPFAATTSARFSAAGEYVLACVADNGTVSAQDEVSVTVTDADVANSITNGLMHRWRADEVLLFDDVTAKTNTLSVMPASAAYVPHMFSYGVRGHAFRPDGFQAYVNSGCTLDETSSNAGQANSAPTTQYRAFSGWIYRESTATNESWAPCIFEAPYTLGFWWGRWDTGKETAFSLFQQGCQVSEAPMNNSGKGPSSVTRYYDFPAGMTKYDCWHHVYVCFDRKGGTDFEVWLDGEQLTTTSTGVCCGRVRTDKFTIGSMSYDANANVVGQINGYYKDKTTGQVYSRCFPGRIDDVRMWGRKLTADEIRYLAANPDDTLNRAPAVDDAVVPARAVNRRPAGIVAAAFDDALPAGGSLTYNWRVVSANAASGVFGNASARETTFTARALGVYTVQLTVSDGERTAYSRPCDIEIVAAGTTVILR